MGKGEQPPERRTDALRSELQTTLPDKSLPPCHLLFKFKKGRRIIATELKWDMQTRQARPQATAEMCPKN